MITLYEQQQKNWDRIAEDGFPSLREMAKHFHMCSEMDRVLGFQNATAAWHAGRKGPSARAAMNAARWLRENITGPRPTESKTDTGAILMVICPPATISKAQKLLAVLGCEVEEI